MLTMLSGIALDRPHYQASSKEGDIIRRTVQHFATLLRLVRVGIASQQLVLLWMSEQSCQAVLRKYHTMSG